MQNFFCVGQYAGTVNYDIYDVYLICNRLFPQGLRGSEGLRMFHIVRVSDSTRLPQVNILFRRNFYGCVPLVSDITSHINLLLILRSKSLDPVE